MKSTIIQANPFNEEHIKMYDEYSETIKENLCKERAYYKDSKVYENYLNKGGTINIRIFKVDDSVITEDCYVEYERDMQICKMNFSNVGNSNFVGEATEFVKDNLEVAALAVFDNNRDKNLVNGLKDSGFDCLGEDAIINGSIYYKEAKKQEEKTIENRNTK